MLVNYEEINPDGYAEYLDNEKYHHTDKGCEIEMVKIDGNRVGEPTCRGLYKKCLTHNVLCSKTGWEQGWYLGTQSKEMIETCKRCGCLIWNKYIQKKKYCSACKEIVNKEMTKANNKLRKEIRLQNKLKANL